MIKKIITAAALVAVALAFHGAPAMANDDHDMSIKNNTGAPLKVIYYKASGSSDAWLPMEGDEGDRGWEKGEAAPIKLDSKYDTTCEFDLKVVTTNGDEWTCGPVSLCAKNGDEVIKTVELTMNNGTLEWSADKE